MTGPTKSTKKILVVEDDPEIRRIITIALTQNGMEVVAAEDGEEGLQKAVTEKPDAILLDIILPKMDGLTLCEKLKATRTTARIPIGFLTAQTESEFYKKAEELGSVLFIPKPFSPKQLIVFVQLLLSSSERPARSDFSFNSFFKKP